MNMVTYTRAPSVPKGQLADIIQGVARQTNTRPGELEVVDLSGFTTIEEQVAELKRRDLADVTPIH